MTKYLTILQPREDGDYDVIAAMIQPDDVSGEIWTEAVQRFIDTVSPGAIVQERQDLPDVLSEEEVSPRQHFIRDEIGRAHV
jgi:hypothetical protein